jgi:hypothetical protein
MGSGAQTSSMRTNQMGQRGGRRPGAGRKMGSVTKVTAQARKQALESGISPLDYMLKVMRNAKAETKRRDDMAKAAAPYLHSHLSSTNVNAKVNVSRGSVARITSDMSLDQAASLWAAKLADLEVETLTEPDETDEREYEMINVTAGPRRLVT